MTLSIVLLCILLLILLVTWGKCNPFLAFLITSILAAWWLGIPPNRINQSVQKGIGDTLGSLTIILMLGAMLGKLVVASGAAQKITSVLMKAFGPRYIQWALMITGFIAGIPLFYNVGFVLMVPLIFSVSYQYKLPTVYIGLPMLAALSVTHGFLPPHPSPTALAGQFNASLGLTLLYGLVIAIPTIIVAGPLFASRLRKIHSQPLQTFQPKYLPEDQLPGTFNSFMTSLLPVMLLALTTVLPYITQPGEKGSQLLAFAGDANMVMLVALILAVFSLGIAQGTSIKAVMDIFGEAVKEVGLILLIVAGAGILKQVFVDSGVSSEIAALLEGWHIHPLLLGWLIAAVIRVCIGSATVAGLTTAGILAPVMPQLSVNPNLMVLSIGAGSLMLSHVNDSGFWMYKEYFNLSIRDTFRSWTVMETIVGIMGLVGVLVLDAFV